MYLKKLEMHGFKSFADRVELAFEPGVTGIVGPNGSGKSNIADAVRWVLGEQNARLLRGSKMEDVIFGGTAKRKALAYCEVILTFDNTDGALDSPYTEIAVGRRLYRTGESEYSINRAACRMKDIVNLFRDTGVGKEGYSIIGQGRIDDILSPRSEDRRAVFEDAAGIAKYNARKEDAERKLNATGQNLQRIEDILEELNGQVEPLREQSETARQYLKLREELRDLEINLFLTQLDRGQARMAENQASLAALAQQEQELEQRLTRLSQQGESQSGQQNEAESGLQVLRQRMLDTARALQAGQGDAKLLEQSAAHAQGERERLQREGEEAQARLAELEGELQTYADALAGQGDRRTGLEGELGELEAQHAALAAQTEAEEARIEARKAALIENLNRLSDVRSRQARAQAMRAALESRQGEVERQRQKAQAEREEIEQELAVAARASAQVRQGLEELRRQAGEAQSGSQALRLRLDQHRHTLRLKREEAAAAEARLKLLGDMKKDYEGYQNSVKRLLADVKRDPRLSRGVHGAVAELLQVPGEYVRAVEIALGPALQNIVTDTEEDSRRLIDHLRARQYGRATFLPLSAVRGRTLNPQERATLGRPGVIGAAADLLGFDPVYRPVVESLLGRTVLVDTLDTAIALMRANRHSFRVVTLEGDMMNPGGSMTGGSIQGRSTGILSRDREIADQQQRLAAARKAMETALAAREQAEANLAGLQQQIDLITENLHQEEIALAREEEREGRIRGRLDQADLLLEQCGLEASQLADNLQDVAGELEETARLQAAMEEREQRGEAEDSQAAYQQLKRQQAELTDAISAKRMLLMSLNQQADGIRRDMERVQRERQRLQEQLVRLAGQQAEQDRALAELAQRRQEGERRLLALQGDSESLQRELEAAQLALDQLREGMRQGEEARRDCETRLRDARETRYRLEVSTAKLESEAQALHDRLWNDYELTYANAQPLRREDFAVAAGGQQAGKLRQQMKAMGEVNVAAIDQYSQVLQRRDSLTVQRDDLVKARVDLGRIIADLQKVMEEQFVDQFAIINQNFGETFSALFGGGRAELRLSDPEAPLACDIQIIAQPPGKKLQIISLLSGGEKALTAIAILFAILRLRPTPFCLLDEIEAPLDEANAVLFADFLREYAQRTQFVMITHRKQTMENCDVLYGVAMEEKGVSRLVSVRLADMSA